HPSRLDLRQVEDVVDQREQVLAGLVDIADEFLLLAVQLAEHVVLEDLREADDRVQRGAQLVRHVRDELALVLVGDLELAALVLDLVEQAHVLDRDHRLVGEGFQEPNVLWRNVASGGPEPDERTDGGALAQQRDSNAVRASIAAKALIVVETGILEDIRDLDGSARENDPSRDACSIA